MEFPWPVKGALDRETVGSGPSPASSFLTDIKQILIFSVHRPLESKELLPVGAGDEHITVLELLRSGSSGTSSGCGVFHSVKAAVGRAPYKNGPAALSAWVCGQWHCPA